MGGEMRTLKDVETCQLCGQDIDPDDDAIDDYGLLAHRACFDQDERAKKALARAARNDPLEWDRE